MIISEKEYLELHKNRQEEYYYRELSAKARRIVRRCFTLGGYYMFEASGHGRHVVRGIGGCHVESFASWDALEERLDEWEQFKR